MNFTKTKSQLAFELPRAIFFNSNFKIKTGFYGGVWGGGGVKPRSVCDWKPVTVRYLISYTQLYLRKYSYRAQTVNVGATSQANITGYCEYCIQIV